MTVAGAPDGDPTVYRQARWKDRVAELELLHATAELSRDADSAGLVAAAKSLGVDLAAVTTAHADAFTSIETLVRERFQATDNGPTP
jgi:hypothetical protein